MNIQESRKISHALEKMVLDSIEERETIEAKKQYIKERFNSEMLHEYNLRRNRQDVMQDWLQGLALDVIYWNHDIILFYEDVLGRELSAKEMATEIDKYWKRLAMVVLKMVRGD